VVKVQEHVASIDDTVKRFEKTINGLPDTINGAVDIKLQPVKKDIGWLMKIGGYILAIVSGVAIMFAGYLLTVGL